MHAREEALSELPVIQKTYDLIQWYVPILNRLPRDHKYALGSRIVAGLYELLEGLIRARFSREKLEKLRALNTELSVLRYQTRLLLDFQLLSTKRFNYVAEYFDAIGSELGGWINYQKDREK